jgi:hypothetical protein
VGKAAGRSRADETLAAELAVGRTVTEAAKAAGISEATAYRRLREKSFNDRVSELRSVMVKTAAGRLADGMTTAADVLRKLLTSKTEGIRLRAACAMLDQAVKVTELFDLQERVAELEEALKQQAAGR